MTERVRTLLRALREALRAGHRAARGFLLELNHSSEDSLFFPIDGSKHLGDPQHIVDALVLDAIEDRLREHLPQIRVVGEESIRSLRIREYPVGIVDPVDGTKPYTHLGEAWATVVLILEHDKETDSVWLPAAGIATSTGLLVTILGENTVSIELLDDPTTARTLIDCSPSLSRSLSVACVAAKSDDSQRQALLRSALPTSTIFNVGGNPVVVGVLTGDLDAIVSFDAQSPWDATYALAIALAGGTVGSIDTNRVFTSAEVLGWFRAPIQGSPSEVKVVPPHVAAKDCSTYEAIVAALADRGKGSGTAG